VCGFPRMTSHLVNGHPTGSTISDPDCSAFPFEFGNSIYGKDYSLDSIYAVLSIALAAGLILILSLRKVTSFL
jgi:hypothetical protein